MNTVCFTAAVAVLLCHAVLGSSETKIAEERQILKNFFDENSSYDKYARPVGNATSDGAVVITTNMYIRQLSMDEANDVIDVDLVFRQEWSDERLKYTSGSDFKYVSSYDAPSKVWTPDLFFSNELRTYFHTAMKPNTYIRIFPNGHVLQSARISLKLQCAFESLNNPLDSQTCDIIFASYGHVTEDLDLHWRSEDPIQVSQDVVKKFGLIKRTPGDCHSSTTTGRYSCLKATLEFSRSARKSSYNKSSSCGSRNHGH